MGLLEHSSAPATSVQPIPGASHCVAFALSEQGESWNAVLVCNHPFHTTQTRMLSFFLCSTSCSCFYKKVVCNSQSTLAAAEPRCMHNCSRLHASMVSVVFSRGRPSSSSHALQLLLAPHVGTVCKVCHPLLLIPACRVLAVGQELHSESDTAARSG